MCKKKFYQLTPSERRSQLIEKNVLTQETALIFQEQTLSEEPLRSHDRKPSE